MTCRGAWHSFRQPAVVDWRRGDCMRIRGVPRMLDKDEIARSRAIQPHDWSVVDSWAKYVATQDIRVLKDELATNPEADVVRGLLYFAFGDRDIRVLELLEQSGISFQEND